MTEVRQSTAEEVFDRLYEDILSLRLLPGSRLSEAETAARLGVSRQPVREAFLRLAKLGFLMVRPQRSTEVRKISEVEVLNAKFIRESIEIAAAEVACERDLSAWMPKLESNLAAQAEALDTSDYARFHMLDDGFHQMFCEAADKAFVWQMVAEHKAHMDRARMLNLQFQAGLADAYADHVAILDALRQADAKKVKAGMKLHLSRIAGALKHIRARNEEYFED